MKLTDKQMAFAQAVLAGKNDRQAAIFAGCSPSSAAQAGHRMARNENIKAYIEQQRNIRNMKGKAKASGKAEGEWATYTQEFDDPMDFLNSVMNDKSLPLADRKSAAVALMPYRHGRQKSTSSAPPRMGKKEQTQQAAAAAADGVFGTAATVAKGEYLQ